MGEIIWLSMHPRNFSSILALSAPWDNQCEMTLFTLIRLVIDVHVTVILDTRTFREEKQQQSRVSSLTKF